MYELRLPPDATILASAKWLVRFKKTRGTTMPYIVKFETTLPIPASRMRPAFQRAYPLSSDPALQFPQHQLADDVHPGLAVVEAGDGGKLFAAIVFEYFGVFLRDFFQRFQAIG